MKILQTPMCGIFVCNHVHLVRNMRRSSSLCLDSLRVCTLAPAFYQISPYGLSQFQATGVLPSVHITEAQLVNLPILLDGTSTMHNKTYQSLSPYRIVQTEINKKNSFVLNIVS